MKTNSTNDLLSVISEILSHAPSLRLGQLLGILTDQTEHPYKSNPIIDIEDYELLPAANEFLQAMRRRQTDLEHENSQPVLARAS